MQRLRRLILISIGASLLNLLIKYWPTDPPAPAPPPPPSQNTIEGGNIHIGTTTPASADTTTRRTYLTVREVATAEAVAERTVTDWINAGHIHPTPTRHGRAWQISPDYRVMPPMPLSAADGGR